MEGCSMGFWEFFACRILQFSDSETFHLLTHTLPHKDYDVHMKTNFPGMESHPRINVDVNTGELIYL